MPSEDVGNVLPKNVRTLYCDMHRLEEHVSGDIRSSVDEYDLFGMAIDAGIIRLHHEHVLIAVLYVGPYRWLMPPMYHPKFGAFSGKDTAEIVVRELKR